MVEKKILVEEKKNGWTVRVRGFIKINGDYVFKSTEILELIEFVGEAVLEKKIKVEKR